MNEIKLTQFSPGAGCGCKISPKDLECILHSDQQIFNHPDLMVGNDTKDDAAVLKISEDIAIISTTDFFTPIVDDPFDFGRIAATNAISDIYAMGGEPVMAIAILGWPLDKLSADIAQKVIDGARQVCSNAQINLAGGHSIDVSDPIFGLAVTGKVHPNKVKQNSKAKAGCNLYLTKPIGIGIVTTAEKRGIVSDAHKHLAIELMTQLNKCGIEYGKLDYVHAMTDVTGFGLLGHLLEVCESSNLSAKINMSNVPIIENIDSYIEQKSLPGGTFRNFKSYGSKVKSVSDRQKAILCDPQTSGGLLIAVDKSHDHDFINFSKKINQDIFLIGELIPRKSEQYFIEIE